MLYHKILLSDFSLVGNPTTLPGIVNGLANPDLADLSWSSVEDLKPYGFWPVIINKLEYDEYNERPDEHSIINLVVDTENMCVSANYEIKPREVTLPKRITKMAFAGLLTLQERAGLLGAKKVIAELTSAEYADIANIGYVYLDVVLQNFELPAEFIELNHPDTILAVSTVLVQSGILTTERAERVLSGLKPE